MVLLSQILKDLAEECKMQPGVFHTIWERILEKLNEKKLQDKKGKGT